TLVNVNNLDSRVVAVQAGAYGEHQFLTAKVDGRIVKVDGPVLYVKLAPGAGGRVEFTVKRYANEATLQQPWNRGWR
ncbi:MAG: hypothetical protein JJE04_21175, partial [Acidobacteriia bacterium]|nr:hypothetical protein [Terriglobia bacterium]